MSEKKLVVVDKIVERIEPRGKKSPVVVHDKEFDRIEHHDENLCPKVSVRYAWEGR